MTSSVREINKETVPQLTVESSESLTKTREVTLGCFQEESNQETQMSAHMNIAPLFWGNLASGVKLTTVTTFLHTAWRSLGKSQTVRTKKQHQARKGEGHSCTSTGLLSWAWLCLSSGPRSCTTSDLQARVRKRADEGGRADRRWTGKEDNQPVQCTIAFPPQLISLNHPSPPG